MDQNGPSLATTRQLEYIRMLEERNRLRKKMKPKKDVKIERLEREFSTNFNGANSERFTMQKAKQPTRRPKSRTAVRSNAIQAPYIQRSCTSAPPARRQWCIGNSEFKVEKEGCLRPTSPEVDSYNFPVDKEPDCNEDENEYLDESFEDFDDIEESYSLDDESIGFLNSKSIPTAYDESFEDKEMPLPPVLSPIQVHNLKVESTHSPIDSPVLKLIKATCPSDIAVLRESLQRIYCEDTDHTMDIIEVDAGILSPRKKESPVEKQRRNKMTMKHVPAILSPRFHECKQNKDTEDIAKSISEAIAEENARARSRDVSRRRRGRKKTQAKFDEKTETSETITDLLGLVQNISRAKQEELVNILQEFAKSDKCSKDIDILQESCSDPDMWKELSQGLQAVQHDKASDQECLAMEDETARRQKEYVQKLKKKHLEEENELKHAEQRRLRRIEQMEDEELEYEQKISQRKQAGLQKLLDEPDSDKKVKPECDSEQRTIKTTLLDIPAGSPCKRGTSKEVRIKLVSSWGNGRTIGIERIAVFDDNDHELPILASTLKIFQGIDGKEVHQSSEMARSLPHLLGDDEKWIGRQPEIGHLEIQFTMKNTASSLRIWNSCKLRERWISARDMEVYVNGSCIWSGSLPELYPVSSPQFTILQLLGPSSNTTAARGGSRSHLEKSPTSPCWLPKNRQGSSRIKDHAAISKTKTPRTRQQNVQPTELLTSVKPMLHNDKLQASWDTLEHFRRGSNNLSRINGSESQDIAIKPEVDISGQKCDTLCTDFQVDSQGLCQIPELPQGKILRLEILSTWGDPYYVGLNGIDMFDHRGQMIKLSDPKSQIRAHPTANVYQEDENDPRQITNLLDDNNLTCDDLHLWLAPFAVGEEHSIRIEFDTTIRLSLLRIWNYNKSRTHSFRGVRVVRALLDDVVVFKGEIRRAPGMITEGIEKCCEVILFTMDEILLQIIDSSDALAGSESVASLTDETSSVVTEALRSMQNTRPQTSDRSILRHKSKAVHNNEKMSNNVVRASNRQSWTETPVETTGSVLRSTSEISVPMTCASFLPHGQCIALVLKSTWGDLQYIGLCGLQVLIGEKGEQCELRLQDVNATPRDLHTLGYAGDSRTLDKLFDDINITTDDNHMWLIPFAAGEKHEIIINLGREELIYGIRIWNYNKNVDDSYRGVRKLDVFLDGECISPSSGFSIRKAPGGTQYDYEQVVHFYAPGTTMFTAQEGTLKAFPRPSYISPVVSQDYEVPIHPIGFQLKFVLKSTWGDPYYIGLNGIEISGQNHMKPENTIKIAADPFSVRDLNFGATDGKLDARIPENLLNGKNYTWDANNSWLAPLASSLGRTEANVVKTPDRGVRDIEIWLDDLQIYSGTLRRAPEAPGLTRTGSVQQTSDFRQPVLFSNEAAIVSREKINIMYCGSEVQDVLCINEGQVVSKSKDMYRTPDHRAYGVTFDINKRPTTSAIQ